MEANALNGGQAKASPAKSKRNRNIAIIVVVVVIAAFAIMIVANANQSQPGASDNIQITSWTIYQSSLGPTTFTVLVSNTGSVSGYGTVSCQANPYPGTGAYTNTQAVNLEPGESQTVYITVETPYGVTITNSMCNAIVY